MKTSTKGKKVKIEAWAVVPINKIDNEVFKTCLVFQENLCNFTHGVFLNDIGANDYCERISKGIPSKVIPCTITYNL